MSDRIKTLAEAFKAVGDLKRMKIIKILASSMEDTVCVSDIAEKLQISQPAASQHIKILKNIGILEEKRIGFRVFYSINMAVWCRFKRDIDDFFQKGFEKCPNNLDCENCDFNCKG